MIQSIPSTDPSLLRRIKQGESAAWDHLHRVYFEWLCQWAEQKGAIRQDAEDAASEVLLTLVEQLSKFDYDRNRSFRGFLRHILRQRISKINQLQRCATNQETRLKELFGTDDAADGVLDVLMRDEEAIRVAEVLPKVASALDHHVWQSWHMTVLNGEPAKEVAANLAIPVGNVYAYKSRVNRRIRQYLSTGDA